MSFTAKMASFLREDEHRITRSSIHGHLRHLDATHLSSTPVPTSADAGSTSSHPGQTATVNFAPSISLPGTGQAGHRRGHSYGPSAPLRTNHFSGMLRRPFLAGTTARGRPNTSVAVDDPNSYPMPINGRLAPPPGFGLQPQDPHPQLGRSRHATVPTASDIKSCFGPSGQAPDQENKYRTSAASSATWPASARQPWTPRNIWKSGPTPTVYHPVRSPIGPPVATLNSATPGLEVAAARRPRQDDRVFHPMNSIQVTGDRRNRLAVVPTRETIQRIAAGFSPNYQGNIHIERNRSADIPAGENCSLFVIGLPPDVTTRQLLASIRRAGRIYATHINPPEPEKNHLSSAAKIIFFEVEAARRFCESASLGGFVVGGQKARVVHNRIRTAAAPDPKHSSRVLIIYGPKHMVNAETLTVFFRSKLDFQIDEIINLPSPANQPGFGLIEYRFGSYRCQAQAAKMALSREFSEIKVYYGVDPCA